MREKYEIKLSQPQKWTVLEKERESKNIAILHFVTTFHNFAPRIETVWGKMGG